MINARLNVFVFGVLSGTLGVACGGDANRRLAESGGDSASTSGGTTHAGGTRASGGTTARGGSSATGGATAAGGATSMGGTAQTGGVPGSTSTGGSANTAGASSSGGTNNTGGSKATGGAINTGGSKATGGAINTGGSKATGGAINTGGTKAVGGTGTTGGTMAGGSTIGGNKATGGGSGTVTGGTRATGGAATGGAATGGSKATGGATTGGAATGGAATGGAQPTGGAATGGAATGGAINTGGSDASGGAGTGGTSAACPDLSLSCGDTVCQEGCETAQTCPADCGALVFANGDARRVATPAWVSGDHIAECGFQPMTGLSVSTGVVALAHAALCGFDDPVMFPHTACTAFAFGQSSQRYYTATGDWDPNMFIGECAEDGYVAGIGMFPGGIVDALLCCTGQGITHSNCSTETMYGGDALEPGVTSGDWDPSYYKGECGPGRYIAGVAANQFTLGNHSILCCSP